MSPKRYRRIFASDSFISSLRLQQRSWWSGFCYWNKRECDLNQSKDGSFVKRVAKNNNWNNGDRHKIHKKFLIKCFRCNSSLTNSTQFGNGSHSRKFNGENIATNCCRVTVLALDSLTKNTLATKLSWKIFPSDQQVGKAYMYW